MSDLLLLAHSSSLTTNQLSFQEGAEEITAAGQSGVPYCEVEVLYSSYVLILMHYIHLRYSYVLYSSYVLTRHTTSTLGTLRSCLELSGRALLRRRRSNGHGPSLHCSSRRYGMYILPYHSLSPPSRYLSHPLATLSLSLTSSHHPTTTLSPTLTISHLRPAIVMGDEENECAVCCSHSARR
jgi:hypothetical protein